MFWKKKIAWDALPAFAEEKAAAERERQRQVRAALLEEFEAAKVALQEKIGALEQATLLNSAIPERQKHFMTGNREAYVLRVRQWMLALPTEESLDAWLTTFAEQHEALGKALHRPFTILQEFLANEAEAIATEIGKVEKRAKAYKQSHDGWVQVVALIAELQRVDELAAEQKKAVAKWQVQVQEKKDELVRVRAAWERTKASEEYKMFLQARKEHEELLLKEQQVMNAWRSVMSPLASVFKKLGRDAFQFTDELQRATEDSASLLELEESIYNNFMEYVKKQVKTVPLKEEKQRRAEQALRVAVRPLAELVEIRDRIARNDLNNPLRHAEDQAQREMIEVQRALARLEQEEFPTPKSKEAIKGEILDAVRKLEPKLVVSNA